MNTFAAIYPVSRLFNRDGNTYSTRRWIVNVGEGQVEYPVFALAANALSSAGFELNCVVEDVLVWVKKEASGDS